MVTGGDWLGRAGGSVSFCGPPGGEPCPQLPRLPAHHPPALQAPFGANGPFSMAGLHTGTRERGSAAELGSRLVPRVPGRLASLADVQLCAILWTIASQAPLSMGFPKQEYWRGLPLPSPGNLPNPGFEPGSLASADGFFTAEPPGKLCEV